MQAHDVGSGDCVYDTTQHNLLTNDGADLYRDLIFGDSTDTPSHMAIGTDNTAAAVTDTALGSEVDRNSFATSTTSSTGQITYKGFWSSTEANGNTIAEVGLFNASSSGTMSNRVVLASTVAKTSSVSLTVTWTITISDNS